MIARLITPGLLIAASFLVLPNAASAQARYTPPAGSPIPNALNYFRFDGLTPLLDNYRGVVVPQRNLNYELNSMANRQQSDFRTTQRLLQDIRQSEAAPTGTGATFLNYSHYYRGGGGGGGGGQRAAQGASRR